MQQPQPVSQVSARPFPQAQNPPAPSTPQSNIGAHPNKRPRVSPAPTSQPTSLPVSPYPQSQSATTPSLAPINTAANTTSDFTNMSASSHQNYNMAYVNGGSTPNLNPQSLNMPLAQASPTPGTPGTPSVLGTQYTNATMTPITMSHAATPTGPGVMGPPSKPADRPVREYEYDISDSLAGTGIDIRQEEQMLTDYYSGAFEADARTGLPSNTAGARASLYGSGLMVQAAQATNARSHEQLVAQSAERAWNESAHRLAVIRNNEISSPFLNIAVLHGRADKIAREHGIRLNDDMKSSQGTGKMKAAHEFERPRAQVSTKVGPDGCIVHTFGSFIPHDAYLVDQLALLSIAAKHRLRERIEDGLKIATTRQASSHGEIPADWADAAIPLDISPAVDGLLNTESGTETGSLKRSFDAFQAANKTATKATNHLASAMRELGKADRDAEEERLRKRQRRLNPELAAPVSRASSVAPGTPGGIAPEPEKVSSKKETKKGANARTIAETSATANANQTLNTLMGFGSRRKGKSYSWMTGGSGASTPRPNPVDPGTPSTTPGPRVQEKTSLTADGRSRLGIWREDGDRGKNIQLRDWVNALEMERLDIRAMQNAYLKLDESTPR